MYPEKRYPSATLGKLKRKKPPFLIDLFYSRLFYLGALWYGLGKGFLAGLWLLFVFAILRSNLPSLNYNYPTLLGTSALVFTGEFAYRVNLYLKTRGK